MYANSVASGRGAGSLADLSGKSVSGAARGPEEAEVWRGVGWSVPRRFLK
jgi:hypothetical protein